MSVEENKRLVQRYVAEVWNAGSVDVLDEIYDPNFTEFGGIPGLRESVIGFRTSFPDLISKLTMSSPRTIKSCIAGLRGALITVRMTALPLLATR